MSSAMQPIYLYFSGPKVYLESFQYGVIVTEKRGSLDFVFENSMFSKRLHILKYLKRRLKSIFFKTLLFEAPLQVNGLHVIYNTYECII